MSDFVITTNNNKHFIQLCNNGEVNINGKKTSVSFLSINEYAAVLKINGKSYEVAYTKFENGKYGILLEGMYFETIIRTKLQESVNELISKKAKQSSRIDYKAPMPGLILKIFKRKDEKVSPGDSLVILEAMKMENDLKASKSGIIKNIFVKEGDSVEKDFIILTIE